MSLKEKIKAADDIKKKLVSVPEWEVEIEVRTMTGTQRAMALDVSMDDKGNVIHQVFHRELIKACCYDPETGEKVFDDGDNEWMMDKNSASIQTLVQAAMGVSGLSPGAGAEAEKN